jgi:hypothetical protein
MTVLMKPMITCAASLLTSQYIMEALMHDKHMKEWLVWLSEQCWNDSEHETVQYNIGIQPQRKTCSNLGGGDFVPPDSFICEMDWITA